MPDSTPRDKTTSNRTRGKAKAESTSTASGSPAQGAESPAAAAAAAVAGVQATPKSRKDAASSSGAASDDASTTVATTGSGGARASASSSAVASTAAAARSAAVLRADVIEAIVSARHGDPFSVLGPHEIAPGQWEIRAMMPHASRVVIISRDEKRSLAPMYRAHPAGFFIATIQSDGKPSYCLAVDSAAGSTIEHDPYSFGTSITGDDLNSLRDVGSDRPFHILGAHGITIDGVKGFRFAV
jgi:1,4-alpha-glucan branching enzyme